MQISEDSRRRCGVCKVGTMIKSDVIPDDVSPAGVSLDIDVFECIDCGSSLKLRPLASLFMYCFMGIIGGWVSLYFIWSEYGNLVQLPEPYFSEMLPSYFNILDISILLIQSVFISCFIYVFSISIDGFFLRLQNYSLNATGEEIGRIGRLFLLSGLGVGAAIGCFWVLSWFNEKQETFSIDADVVHAMFSGIFIAAFLTNARRFSATGPLVLISCLLWVAFGFWVVS
jgi:hypothetical protein